MVSHLEAARRSKNDEYYTRYVDIEKELSNYPTQFEGKTVYCNCDNPFKSNFIKYFIRNLNRLGIKRLIATHYVSPDSGEQAYKADITSVDDTHDYSDDAIHYDRIFASPYNTLTESQGGGYGSPESLGLLKEADIVVTNPPFSLFRDFYPTLMDSGTQFLIVGPLHAVEYRSVFPTLQSQAVGAYAHGHGNNMWFEAGPQVEQDYRDTGILDKKYKIVDDVIMAHVIAVWFTTMGRSTTPPPLPLIKRFDPAEYPVYDECDAINVDRLADIPFDYNGVMGVPITIVTKWNPEQFEVLGTLDKTEVNGVRKFRRFLIRAL